MSGSFDFWRSARPPVQVPARICFDLKELGIHIHTHMYRDIQICTYRYIYAYTHLQVRPCIRCKDTWTLQDKVCIKLYLTISEGRGRLYGPSLHENLEVYIPQFESSGLWSRDRCIRGPKGYINTRILQTMVSGTISFWAIEPECRIRLPGNMLSSCRSCHKDPFSSPCIGTTENNMGPPSR